ncbi:MAG: alpha/beta hydrolase [Ilumatobacteraceae bacterium]
MVMIESAHVTANGVDVAYLHCGEGPLALCLHGFPDSAHTWRDLLPELAEAGFRAVAPFLRGYAPTAIPADGRYQMGVLAQDAIALHDVLGGDDQAVIIGHDYGAGATYGAANAAPDRWRRVVALALPPGDALLQGFLTSVDQLQRSWYMFFFQHPLAEPVVAGNDLAFIDRLWSDWSPGFDAAEDLDLLKPSLRDPANLAAALGYYRAALSGVGVDPALEDLQQATQQVPVLPTLYLHGADDGCIGPEVSALAAAAAPPNVRFEVVAGAGHFLHREQPAAVNRLVLAHVTA